jgi:hypothetical protein
VCFHVDPDSWLAKVILVAGLPLFVGFLVYVMMNFGRALQSYGWPAADGLVVESVVEKLWDMHGLPHSKAKIRYVYPVAGRQLENDTIAFGGVRGQLTWGYADSKAGTFPKGRAVPVYYDPEHPEVSCLERGGVGWEDCFMLVVSGAGIALGARELRKAIRRLAPKKPLQQTGHVNNDFPEYESRSV